MGKFDKNEAKFALFDPFSREFFVALFEVITVVPI